MTQRRTSSATSRFDLAFRAGVGVLACMLVAGMTSSIPKQRLNPVLDLLGAAPLVSVPAAASALALRAPATVNPDAQPEAPAAAPAPAPVQQQAKVDYSLTADAGYYNQLRKKMRWLPVRMGNAQLATPDLDSRMLLARSAAQRAGLGEVGLNHRDVYGIINAETSWIPRTGASKDGTPNHGIAQFEPATARALGLRNPHDPVEAVHVAALHLKEAAEWSANRLAKLRLSPSQYATKLREGISIYYNLSSKGRAVWNGMNTHKLPRETQLHIRNARVGAQEAALVEAQQMAQRRYASDRSRDTVTAGMMRASN